MPLSYSQQSNPYANLDWSNLVSQYNNEANRIANMGAETGGASANVWLPDGSSFTSMGNGDYQLVRPNSREGDQYVRISPDGNGGWSTRDDTIRADHGWMDKLGQVAEVAVPLGIAAIAGGAAGLWNLPTLGAEAAGAGGAAGSFAIPTAEELAAFGADVNGMGMTGAGGIGSASSVVGAGAGAAGYGTGALAAGLTVDGIDQLANEAAKLTQQQALAQSGVDLLPTNLPTIDLSGNFLDMIPSQARDLITPSNILRLASALMGGRNGSRGRMSPDTSLLNYLGKDYTPRIIPGGGSAPELTQHTTAPFLIPDPEQPRFNFGGYIPIQSEDSSMITKLAQALQKG